MVQCPGINGAWPVLCSRLHKATFKVRAALCSFLDLCGRIFFQTQPPYVQNSVPGVQVPVSLGPVSKGVFLSLPAFFSTFPLCPHSRQGQVESFPHFRPAISLLPHFCPLLAGETALISRAQVMRLGTLKRWGLRW